MRNHIIEQDLDFIVSANLPWEDLSHKTVLISGAAGFLPSYMVETLAFLNQTKHLNIRIIALVRHISKANARFAHLLGKSYLQLLEQDV
jgi:thioester reductase-like protein